MSSIFRPALILTGGRVIAFGATIFIPVVLARVFTQDEFGTYKQFFLIFSTLIAIAQLGMAESLFYFLPRTNEHPGRYVFNSTAILLVSGIFFGAFLSSQKLTISSFLSNSELNQHLPLLAVYLTLMLASASLEIVMISRRQYLVAAFTYGGADVMRAAFLILPALFFRDLHALVLGGVAFALLRFLGSLVYFGSVFGKYFKPSLKMLRTQLAYAVPFEIAVFFETVQSQYHQYAVSHYFDAAQFAIYTVGCAPIPIVDFLANPACNVMMVRMSEEIRDGRSRAVISLWHDTTRKLALVFLPLAGLLLVTAKMSIVFLYTKSYAASVPIFLIWLLTVVFSTLQTNAVLRVYADMRFLWLQNVLRLVITAALIYPCLSAFGLVGGVFVTIMSLGVAKALSLVRMKTLFKVKFSEVLPWRTLAAIFMACAAASLAAFGVELTLQLPLLPALLITSTAYVAVYFILVMRFDLLTESELGHISNWLHRMNVLSAYASGSKG